jgi:hypothetical protein
MEHQSEGSERKDGNNNAIYNVRTAEPDARRDQSNNQDQAQEKGTLNEQVGTDRNAG